MNLNKFCSLQTSGGHLMTNLLAQFPIEVQIPLPLHNDAVYDSAAAWADATFGSASFVEVAYRYFFNTDSNAMQFKLAWCL
jgi:hypothetical protein